MKLLLNLNFVPSYCPHDHDARKLVIGKDDWPVEFIIGRPIQNFLRRFIHGDHFRDGGGIVKKNDSSGAPGARRADRSTRRMIAVLYLPSYLD